MYSGTLHFPACLVRSGRRARLRVILFHSLMTYRTLLLSVLFSAVALTFASLKGNVSADDYSGPYAGLSSITSMQSASYFLSDDFVLRLLGPRCGNGAVETGEACDDDNRRNGDGCSSVCQQEAQTLCEGNHKVGDNYPSSDGCNVCSCTVNGSICTLRACAVSSSSASSESSEATPESETAKCTSSNQCGNDAYCTTEDGACESACEPGAEMCAQVCSGVCKSRDADTSCAPYICRDGTEHASCGPDGHPMYYFADPCLTHGGGA